MVTTNTRNFIKIEIFGVKKVFQNFYHGFRYHWANFYNILKNFPKVIGDRYKLVLRGINSTALLNSKLFLKDYARKA